MHVSVWRIKFRFVQFVVFLVYGTEVLELDEQLTAKVLGAEFAIATVIYYVCQT